MTTPVQTRRPTVPWERTEGRIKPLFSLRCHEVSSLPGGGECRLAAAARRCRAASRPSPLPLLLSLLSPPPYTHVSAVAAYRSSRARAISLLGPLTVAAGLIWAIVQPYRLTLLHPRHQGFWWLVAEPPLLVAAGRGLLFSVAVARPLIADLEEHDGTPR